MTRTATTRTEPRPAAESSDCPACGTAVYPGDWVVEGDVHLGCAGRQR